jgi:hypothetical protein
MFTKFSECVTDAGCIPPAVLNLSNGIMKFYPWFLKVSMALQRLIQ